MSGVEFPPTIQFSAQVLEATKGKNKKGAPVTLLPDGQPHRIYFPFGDFKAFTNAYGTSYKYSAEYQGQRHTLFANQRLHESLQAGGVSAMTTMQVTRTMRPFTTSDGQDRTVAEFEVNRVYDDGGTTDQFVESVGGDVVGGQY